MHYFAGCHNVTEIKSLYRKLAMEHHPDHGGNCQGEASDHIAPLSVALRHQTGARGSKQNRAAPPERAVEGFGREDSGGESGPDFLLKRQGIRRQFVVGGLHQELVEATAMLD